LPSTPLRHHRCGPSAGHSGPSVGPSATRQRQPAVRAGTPESYAVGRRRRLPDSAGS